MYQLKGRCSIILTLHKLTFHVGEDRRREKRLKLNFASSQGPFHVFTTTRKHRLLTWRQTGDSTVAEKPLQDSYRRLAPLPKPSPIPSPPSPCQAALPHPSAAEAMGALPLRCQLWLLLQLLSRGNFGKDHTPSLELCFHLAFWKSWACRAELWASNTHCNFLSAESKLQSDRANRSWQKAAFKFLVFLLNLPLMRSCR